MRLKALLWDVDGTLAETERDGHRVAFNRAFEEHGLDWRWSVDAYREKLAVTGGRERLLAEMERRDDAPPDAAARDALARTLHAAKNRHYAALAGAIPLRPGVAALLDDARRAGIASAVVTTTSRANVEALLAATLGDGWSDRFATLVCGEDVAHKKPDPEAHRLALQRLGLPAADGVAIEDAPAGVAAARAAGVAVLVTRSVYFADDAMDGALAVVPDLTGITVAAIERLLSAA